MRLTKLRSIMLVVASMRAALELAMILLLLSIVTKSRLIAYLLSFFFSSRRRHTRFDCDWSSDVCSSDLDDDVPGAEIVAVIGLGRVAGGRAEVAEIASRGAARVVFVITRRRVGARFVAAPRGVVAVREVIGRAAGIGVVTQREHRSGNRVEQVRGGVVVGAVAARDVAGPDQRHGARDRAEAGPGVRSSLDRGLGSLVATAGGDRQQGEERTDRGGEV